MGTNGTTAIVCGDRRVEARLPERTLVLRAPEPRPPLADPEGAIREALRAPIGHDPVSRLVGPASKVVVAFDDPVIPQHPMKPPDFRALAIPILLEELEQAGVKRHNVTLVCANALHRKWTTGELATVIGSDVAAAFGPSHLYCHDAEDPERLVFLGETERGLEVEINRAAVEADQLFYVNVTSLPFHGGWKSLSVGLSSFRSIRHHHRPFRAASGKSVMDAKRSSFQKLMGEIGQVIEGALAEKGTRPFTIESVLNTASPAELVAVFAGHVPEVHDRTLDALYEQQVLPVERQVDVGLYGVPNSAYYANLSRINPILVRNQALSYSFGLYQQRPLVREGGIAIFVNPCARQFEPRHHPSYVELFDDHLPHTQDPFELWELLSEDFAHRPEYVHRYRYAFGFHGAHPLILWGQGAFPLRHLGRAFLAGAEDPEAARRVGFEPFETVEDALAEAESVLGKDCSVAYQDPAVPFVASVGDGGA
jgi:nickel-dependent lactate racemase